MPIRRLCRDAMEQGRARDIRHPWLSVRPCDTQPDPFHAPFGSLDIHQGWRLDLPALLARSAARWAMPDQAAACFDWTAIRSQGQGVRWQGHAIDCVVSCEGAAISANPYWRGLPLLANGGESLILELPVDLEYAISADFTLLPLGRRIYWLGATHQPGCATCGPTNTARARLLKTLSARLTKPLPIKVIKHSAGTRMAPADREPVLGRHPQHAWLAIFNGLGSRGILRAPESALQLAQHLTAGASLAPERDVMRYAQRLAQRERPWHK
jgi:glycine/D-amino acid oxidase-like deaminating enzyme